MTLLERLDAAVRECNDALRTGAYDLEIADMRDLLEDAAKAIRHHQMMQSEAVHTFAERLMRDDRPHR